jgi:hypothetical protein
VDWVGLDLGKWTHGQLWVQITEKNSAKVENPAKVMLCMKNYESIFRKQQLMQRQFRNVASSAQARVGS